MRIGSVALEFSVQTMGRHTLLNEIRRARFGDGGDGDLRTDLLLFQRILSREGRGALSPAAIRNWFEAGGRNSQPTRVDSLRFINTYLDWLEKNAMFVDSVTFKKVKAYVHTYEVPSRLNHEVRVDSNRPERIRAIIGEYQIIRPYATNPDTYILEPFGITNSRLGSERSCIMYSHRHPNHQLHYRGDIEFVSHGCFALLRRPHEVNQGARSIRMIGIRLEKEQMYENMFPSVSCLSGVMLRATGYGSVPRMVVGIPFLAIKTNSESNDLLSGNIQRVSNNIHKRGELLIGRIDKTKKKMFEFCSKIFPPDATKNSLMDINLTCIKTLDGMALGSIVNPDAVEEKDYFEYWRALVRYDLHV